MDREKMTKRMQELVALLNKASKAYYQDAQEMMSNFEYDALYDELVQLEKELDMVMSNSPTQNVGYEVLSELPKERHESPMLSLDKTKDIEALKSFAGNEKVVISWKLDGLTIVLTYRDGELVKAVTRGNGEVGEVITNNARVFQNIPLRIEYKGELIIRGEAVIGYEDFRKINEQIAETDAKYKNPRNLCSGSVRQLNNEVTAKRNVKFFAFSLVQAENVDFHNSRAYQLDWLGNQGFEVVEHFVIGKDDLEDQVAYFAEQIKRNDFPSDGLVLVYDDIAYGRSLGRTSKFPRDSFAFKWADETARTHLLEIEWSPSRTGLINPVAIFDPVELEGTTVSRASVHNISMIEELKLGIGDEIEVYKANMIIPQIAKNLTGRGELPIPEICPVCGGATEIRKISNAKALYCTNPDCQAKHVKAFSLFVSRDALNMEGLSEATLEKFIAKGFIHNYTDLFHLDRYAKEIQEMDGFGEKSYQNLIASVEKARETTLPKLIYSLGIPGIGLANAKVICKHFDHDIEKMIHADMEELNEIDGIGEVLARAFTEYFASERNTDLVHRLLDELEIAMEATNQEDQIFAGKNFVITGSVNHFANRNEVKALIESKGGKVTGSVTSKTDYLINNDVTSSSSKNKKAKDLGIPIISEDDFIKML
ncbi:MAG: NAD-dependent DNA ligase LigA [Eubacteriales bacterium]|nr:NAD-dependent DNA ligase LigA [Eubacteriales bacterium]